MPELFTSYLDKVCEQVRWKRAHACIRRELGDHLEDEHAALIASGASEEEAAGGAVRDMGDALLIGSQLDRTHRPRPAWGIIAVTAALMVLGLFSREYTAANTESIRTPDVAGSLFYMGAAILVMLAGYFLDYTILGKHPVLIGAGFAAFVIILPFLDSEYITEIPRSVFYIGVYLAVFIPVIFSTILWWWPYKGYDGILGCFAVLAVLGGVTAVFGRLSYALLFSAVCGLMLAVEVLNGRFRVRKRYGLAVLCAPAALFGLLLEKIYPRFFGDVSDRLMTVLHPWREYHGGGFWEIQIREVLAGAKWLGQGGHTLENLPGSPTDYLLTYYIHQFGWVSLVVVLLLFGTLFTLSALKIKRQKSKLGRMVASAILLSLIIQCAIYTINSMSGWISFSVLPLISYGNAALLIHSFLIGLMLSVFRANDIVRDTAIEPKVIPRFKISFERIN